MFSLEKGMTLDIRTLVVAVVIVAAFSAAARFLLWRQHRSIPGLGQWCVSMLIGAVTLGLIAAPDRLVSEYSFALAPTMVCVGFGVVWDGFRRFTGRPPLSWAMIGFIGAVAILSLPVIFLQGSMAFRSGLNVSVAGVICAIISRDLFVSAGRRLVAMRITAMIYAANAVFFLGRALTFFTDTANAAPMSLDGISTVTALGWLGMPLAVTLGMVLMTGERLQLEVNQKMISLDEVTAQKLAEERMRLAEKERMEGALRQWMADSSHELRTPISVLRAQIEAIQDGVFAADAKRLEVLHCEVMGMTRLVEDLFVLARSDIGQLECRSDPVDILDVLDGVVHAFSGRYAAAGIALQWPESIVDGPLVSGDSERLRQVFSNLLENSLRYTDSGGMLRISHRLDGHDLLLHFDDSPPGVPEAILPQLFDRFFRVDVSRSRARGGSGLGLALCRTLVEAHGGTITASLSPLGGLRITLQLCRMEQA